MREVGLIVLYGTALAIAGSGAIWLVLAGGAVVIGAVAGVSTAGAFYTLLLRPQRLALEARIRALETALQAPCRHCGRAANEPAETNASAAVARVAS